MDEIHEKKKEIRQEISATLSALSKEEKSGIVELIEKRLFDFANFLESKIVLLYVESPNEVSTFNIIRRSYMLQKIVVLPAYDYEKEEISLHKIDNPDKDVIPGPRGILGPNPDRCKRVPVDCIDIAIIPAIALDEKGGRIGKGDGWYDRLIPQLPITTRKVALGFDCQVTLQIPMEPHDKHVDIIITEKRIIYKI
jgi:5-formyltetrahydrofolate cyclo-ligase